MEEKEVSHIGLASDPFLTALFTYIIPDGTILGNVEALRRKVLTMFFKFFRISENLESLSPYLTGPEHSYNLPQCTQKICSFVIHWISVITGTIHQFIDNGVSFHFIIFTSMGTDNVKYITAMYFSLDDVAYYTVIQSGAIRLNSRTSKDALIVPSVIKLNRYENHLYLGLHEVDRFLVSSITSCTRKKTIDQFTNQRNVSNSALSLSELFKGEIPFSTSLEGAHSSMVEFNSTVVAESTPSEVV